MAEGQACNLKADERRWAMNPDSHEEPGTTPQRIEFGEERPREELHAGSERAQGWAILWIAAAAIVAAVIIAFVIF
jgi:hypothetical protein